MQRFRTSLTVFSLSAFLALMILPLGCDIESGDEVVRTVEINIAGFYEGNNAGGAVTTRQSGATVTSIAITQNGDRVEGTDNTGTRWRGNINNVSGDRANITLRGTTTTGVEVVITGTVIISGNSASFTGSWVEPNLTGAFSANGTVSPQPTATPDSGDGSGTPTATPTPIPTSANNGGGGIVLPPVPS